MSVSCLKDNVSSSASSTGLHKPSWCAPTSVAREMRWPKGNTEVIYNIDEIPEIVSAFTSYHQRLLDLDVAEASKDGRMNVVYDEFVCLCNDASWSACMYPVPSLESRIIKKKSRRPGRKKKKRKDAPWFDDELVLMRAQLRREQRIRKKKKGFDVPDGVAKKSSLCNVYIRKYKKKKWIWRKERLKQLEYICKENKSLFWSTIDRLLDIAPPHELPVDVRKVATHFQGATFDKDAPLSFIGSNNQRSSNVNNDSTVSDLTLVDIVRKNVYFSIDEIHVALSKVKNGKAPGWDSIPAHVFTSLRNSELFLSTLHALFSLFVHVGYWPQEWNEILIAPVHKPGKPPEEAESYRPIHLISILPKVFASLVEVKLGTWVARSDEQFGFSKGHGARDNVFVLSALFEKYISDGIHCVFVDFEGAFDSINRSKLIDKLVSLGVDGKFVDLIKGMYSNVSACEGVLRAFY